MEKSVVSAVRVSLNVSVPLVEVNAPPVIENKPDTVIFPLPPLNVPDVVRLPVRVMVPVVVCVSVPEIVRFFEVSVPPAGSVSVSPDSISSVGLVYEFVQPVTASEVDVVAYITSSSLL